MQTTREAFVTGGEMTEADDGLILRQDFSAQSIGGRRANVRLADGAVSIDNIPALLAAWEAICGRPGWGTDGDPATAEAFLRRTQGRGVLHARQL
jgi:hypothetical protein